MRAWKLLGLAGLAGVAATGAVLARNERRRRAYTPEQVRARLHERHDAVVAAGPAPELPPPTVEELFRGRTHRLARLLRRGQVHQPASSSPRCQNSNAAP